jgi:hypothetical protein
MNWFLSNPLSFNDKERLNVLRELISQIYRGQRAEGQLEDISGYYDQETLLALDNLPNTRQSPARAKLVKAGIYWILYETFEQELAGYFKRATLLKATKIVHYDGH